MEQKWFLPKIVLELVEELIFLVPFPMLWDRSCDDEVDDVHVPEGVTRDGEEIDGSFSRFVKSQRRWSNKIYKTELTKIRYKNQLLCKYRVDPQREGLTLIAELMM